jgi:hypothetical protein
VTVPMRGLLRVVCVKFSKKILGMWAEVKPRARSGAFGESSAQRPQRLSSWPHDEFFVFAEPEPVLMGLDGQGPD